MPQYLSTDPNAGTPVRSISRPPMANNEPAFRKWYTARAKKLGLSDDPDDPQQFYDYRAAYRAGAEPDESGHWPSNFKKEGHPNLVVGVLDTRTGQPTGEQPVASREALTQSGWSSEAAERAQSPYLSTDPNAGTEPQEPDFSTDNARDEQGRVIVRDQERTWIDELVDVGRGWWQNVNPVNAIKATGGAIMHPVETVKAVGAAQGALAVKAEEAFKQGDYITGSRHLLNYLLPLIGPALDESSDDIAEGRYAEGVGKALGLGTSVVVPSVIGRIPKARVLPSISTRTRNPVESAAIEFGEQRGIPLDAATATGRPALRAIEKRVANSMGGEATASKMIRDQQEGFTRVGRELADETHPSTVTSQQAGESLRQSLETRVTGLNDAATRAYDTLRQLEAQTPAQTRSVTPGAPVQSMRLAVDLRPVRAQLEPLYKELTRERELVGTLQGGKARTLVALDTLMQADDFAPLSVVDGALGELKSLARTKGIPATRTPGQATAAQAVMALEKEVQAAAHRGGPPVVKALTDGRTATKQKYAVMDVLDGLSDEPVKTIRSLVAPDDSAIARLKSIQQIAPQEMPKIGRAYLEDMLDTATESGRFDHVDKLYADWQKLGGETKKLLFPRPDLVASLDKFFLLAKRTAENPNPSGTAHALTVLNVASQPGMWALAKLLYTPQGVRALTRGLELSLMPSSLTARRTAIANLTNVAREAGISLEALPAGADQQADTAPTVKVGQVVTVGGHRVRVTKVHPDGTFDGGRVK